MNREEKKTIVSLAIEIAVKNGKLKVADVIEINELQKDIEANSTRLLEYFNAFNMGGCYPLEMAATLYFILKTKTEKTDESD